MYNAFTHSEYDLVQTAIRISNTDSFLTKMQNFEFAVPNYLEQLIRTKWGSGIASGNGQFMTVFMASKVRWRNSLLDDLEFSLNGLFFDFEGGFLNDTFLSQLVVTTYRDLIKQRVRWCQGGMQCLFRYAPTIMRSKFISTKLKADIILFMLIPFVSIISMVGSVISIIVFVDELQYVPYLILSILLLILIVGTLISLAMIISANKSGSDFVNDHSVAKLIGYSFANIAYVWMMAPVPYISFFRLITGKNNWHKTDHSLLNS